MTEVIPPADPVDPDDIVDVGDKVRAPTAYERRLRTEAANARRKLAEVNALVEQARALAQQNADKLAAETARLTTEANERLNAETTRVKTEAEAAANARVIR